MAGAGSESEIVRRNTDCVYFLASPLTCKKGSECEYRHSDIARLNPRDCWYWFSGNCLNPTCAFRHPPLEGSSKASSGSAQVQQQSAAATTRTTVPCYFFFNAFCRKGDQCPFSHTVDEISPAQKAPRAVSKETDDGPATADLPLKPTEEETMDNALQEISPSLESLGSSTSDYEGSSAIKPSENPSPKVNYVDQREGSFSDHSSDGLGEDHAEAEERWESSPGFDVLVDGRSEQLAYEDDGDYLQAQEMESEAGLHGQIIHYDYEDSAAYDAINYRPYEGYDDFDDGYAADCAEGDEEQMLYRRKRSHGVEPQGAADLRDHLRKLRRVDFHHPMPLGPREGGSFYSAVSDSSEFPEKRGMALLCSDGLPSEPQLEERWRKAGGPRYLDYGRQRESRERRRERLERRPLRNGRFIEPAAFSLMKDQMHQGRPRSRNPLPRQTRRGELTSADFEGPKPLSEILKDKRRSTPRSELTSVEGHGRGSSVDEEEDDEVDEHEKKVAGILA
ncbi:unnamed protein product [Spirodela intermedia]|uniref:C3H1-type domain-containing protein n=1 Tax=Spirodela intermedia TaxID=51605 RepID=A0A7I8LFT3_SPIIN|nr:unnamed protein product [Spirodela intermedia]